MRHREEISGQEANNLYVISPCKYFQNEPNMNNRWRKSKDRFTNESRMKYKLDKRQPITEQTKIEKEI